MTTEETNRPSGTKPLRAAVAGAGVFGTYHARKYAAHPDVELVAIVDPDLARATKLAEEVGAKAIARLADALPQIEILTVATPAVYHYETAKEALVAGKHVLVEKPLSLSTAHADELITLAEASDLILQVGHQERFVFDAVGLLTRDVAPTKISATRAGPFSGRALDTSVVMDLMIHDLDLIHQVVPGVVAAVEADAKTVHGDHPDEVAAKLTFEDGAEVTLLASRIAGGPNRTMSLTYPDGAVNIDFIGRTVENTTPHQLGDIFGDVDHPVMKDPLGHAVAHFVESVRNKTQPAITGRCGRRALDTALKIHKAAGVAAPAA